MDPRNLDPATTVYDPEDVVEENGLEEGPDFPEMDERESRKTVTQQQNPY